MRKIELNKHVLKYVVIPVGAIIILAAAAFIFLAVRRGKNLILPAPAGPYPVGRQIATWRDGSRQESLGGTPAQSRTLAVWIWYPAEKGGSAVPYMPAAWARAREADRGIGSMLFQAIGSIHGHATDAGIASSGGPFPVLIFEPGLGPLVPEYTTLAEDLASRGYVVIGLNPTYSASITVLGGNAIESTDLGTIPDNATPGQIQQRGDELVGIWAADVRFAISEAIVTNYDSNSQFAGKLDLQHIGVLGHSFGGAAALEACRLDPHCLAAADIDGRPFGGVAGDGPNRPVLVVSSEPDKDAPTQAAQKADGELADILAKAPEGYQVTIRGARHFNFTDYAVGFNPAMRFAGALGSIDGARGLRITCEYLAAFFDRTLKGKQSPLLQGPSKDYPEVGFSSHH